MRNEKTPTRVEIVAKSQRGRAECSCRQESLNLFDADAATTHTHIYIYIAVCVHAFPSRIIIFRARRRDRRGIEYGKLLLLRRLYDFMDYSLVVFLACIIYVGYIEYI